MSKVKVQYETRYHRMHKYIKCMNSSTDSKYYNGTVCNRWVRLHNESAVAALCWLCTGRLVPPPVQSTAQSLQDVVKFPRGWKFKKIFVTSTKDVYFKGVIQPHLHGQYEPTPIQPVVKKTRVKLSKHAKKELKYDLLRELNSIREKLDTPTTMDLAESMKVNSRKLEIEKQLTKL